MPDWIGPFLLGGIVAAIAERALSSWRIRVVTREMQAARRRSDWDRELRLQDLQRLDRSRARAARLRVRVDHLRRDLYELRRKPKEPRDA